MGRLVRLLALAHGASPEKARQIGTAAALHDVGKQKIDPGILNKPGKLTAQEFEAVKTHTTLGAGMLAGLQGELGEMARDCCRWHHEWYNGAGYWGRRADGLPFFVPFVSISDVFTALVSPRPYKEAWPPCEAVAYIKQQSGTQFSPELVGVFLSLVGSDSRVPAIFNGEVIP